jgi:hypothetical protein
MLIGGPINDSNAGQDVIGILPFRESDWKTISYPSTSIAACVIHTDFNCTWSAGANDRYVLKSEGTDPPPMERLDSYPRALQLSNDDILIAFDLDTANPCAPGTYPCGSNPPNPPPNGARDWWVLRAYGGYAGGTDRFEFWRGNSQTGLMDFDRNYAGAVLMHQANTADPFYMLDRVLVFGGADFVSVNASVQEFTPNPGTTGVGGPVVNGSWNGKAPLNVPRHFLNTVALPTGEVLLTQGANSPAPYTSNAVVYPELYNPGRTPLQLGSSLTMAPPNTVGGKWTSRTYHHLAVLLPDGRVFLAGGEAAGSGSSFANGQYSGEIFSPPYLHTGLPRPIIEDSDTKVFMNDVGAVPPHLNKFNVLVAGLDPALTVDRVVLTRPAAVTHGFDSDQRYIELPFSAGIPSAGKVTLSVTAPRENLGPAGIYMLWVVVRDASTPTPVRLPTAAVWLWCI